MKTPKLLTLTLAHTDQPLADQVHRIKECFRRLRARVIWKCLVRGGFWVLEITRNEEKQQWHVHVHAVIDAKYVPHEWLKSQWHQLTGDSFVVDIRHFKPKRSRYLSKYVAKGDSITQSGEALWQFYEALDHTRSAQPFGNCGPLTDCGTSSDSQLQYIGPVCALIARARHGDHEAMQWMP